MKVEFGYGKTTQIVDIPDKNLDGILLANEIEHEFIYIIIIIAKKNLALLFSRTSSYKIIHLPSLLHL